MGEVIDDDIDKITQDFVFILERLKIAGYYSETTNGEIKRLYATNDIVLGMIGTNTKNNPKDANNEWTKFWNKSQLVKKGIIQKFRQNRARSSRMIEVQQFLVWCLFVNGHLLKLTKEARHLYERLCQLKPLLTDYVALDSNLYIPKGTGEPYTVAEAVKRPHDNEYLDRYIEYHAYHHEPRFFRRMFGQHDDLYAAHQITEIGAPYQSSVAARYGIKYLIASMEKKDGVVQIRNDTTLWTRGNSFPFYSMTLIFSYIKSQPISDCMCCLFWDIVNDTMIVKSQ